MKKNFTLFSKISLLFLSVVLAFSACTEEKYYPVEEIYVDNPLAIKFKTEVIRAGDWGWNADRGRYEVEINYPELTDYMYDDGVLNASVFVKYDNFEVQTVLPYIENWMDPTGKPFTEYLSFDVSYDTKSVVYYLQYSDLGRDDSFLPSLYEIKLSFIYYE